MGKTTKKPVITDESKLGINPFTASLTGTMRVFKAKESILTEYSDNMNIIVGTINKTAIVEDAIYTKVYHDTFWRNVILDLSPLALKLWIFINYSLESNKDYIWLNRTFIVSKLRLKNQKELFTLLEQELCRYALLSPISGYADMYWVNPSIAFCGNRLKKYPNNFKER